MRILQVNTFDSGDGASDVARNLHTCYRAEGHEAWMAVGRKRGLEPHVYEIPNGSKSPWSRGVRALASRAARRQPRTAQALRHLADPQRYANWLRGREDFDFPGTYRITTLAPRPPEVIQCHNLHGGYFDLRALAPLSHRVPTVLTLHDAWLLSGHCAHSFDCDRWLRGCGQCPDLTIYPAIRRDATHANWLRKQSIYAGARLFVATPSRWLMDKVERSVLAHAIADARVIPNGVDLSTFRPGDREEARAALGLPRNAAIVLFAAHGIRKNRWKDYRTMQEAVVRVSDQLGGTQTLFLALGEDSPPVRIADAEIRFVPFISDAHSVVRYYRAADVYIHASLADTFPTTVVEALAVGLPVVGTAVGGIPEQIRTLDSHAEPTGVLVPPHEPEAMASSISSLLLDRELRGRLGANAARDAFDRFDLSRQARNYLEWYQAMSIQG